MNGIDTNVLVRLITRDDPHQARRAADLVAAAGEGELFINVVVLAELAWVLKRGYRYAAGEILDIIQGLLDSREFSVGQRPLVADAVRNARSAGCGFADALIERLNIASDVGTTFTFDTRARRLSSMKSVAP